MQHYKIIRNILLAMFICAVTFVISELAVSKNETSNATSNNSFAIVKDGISADSISKAEIAEYRKNFESVEKMISRRMGSYDEAKRSFNSISGSRVRSLPEFAGRYSAMQQKLSAWNLEVNPKEPPVKVPNNPNNPRNSGKGNEQNAKPIEEDKNTGEMERKSAMLSYFPDTLTVGNDFLAYVEITKNNTIQYDNRNGNVNSTLDSIVLGTYGMRTGVVNSSVTVDLSLDGSNSGFTINPRSESKTKVIGDNGDARWEWMMHPNTEGEYRLRLTVKYQKVNKDGTTQEAPAITKVFVVKGLPRKVAEPSSNLLWIALGLLALIIIVAAVMLSGKNKRNKYRDEQVRNDRLREEQIRNEQIRKDNNRDDLNR
ncbi:MAG: hypothetical protein JST55_11710 [Bacteroidetes bacterium]|nr:hypothetical protein [Bacteroidota bacterium]